MLCQMNPSIEDINRVMPQLNKYAAYLFQTTREFDDVDSLQRHTFIHKSKSFDALPPDSDALKLHTQRAAYQAGYVWGKFLVPMMIHHLRMIGVGQKHQTDMSLNGHQLMSYQRNSHL